LIYSFANSSSVIILYFVLHYILGAEKNTCTVSDTQEDELMSSEEQSTSPAVNENVFQTIERSSFDIGATTISPQYSKKRKHTTSREQTTRISARLQPKRSRLS
jgi:hypothetical protein